MNYVVCIAAELRWLLMKMWILRKTLCGALEKKDQIKFKIYSKKLVSKIIFTSSGKKAHVSSWPLNDVRGTSNE